MKKLLITFAATTLTPSAALAVPLPKPEDVAGPAERPLLSRLSSALEQDRKAAIAPLDALLAQLPQPTQFRGLVQFLRAGLLFQDNQSKDALDAISESIRLLPSYSAPLLVAAQVNAYGDRPDQAADYLLRASQIDPEIVNAFDDYDMFALLIRLGEFNYTRHRSALSERLLAIGWTGGTSKTISAMAFFALEDRIGRGDVTGASAMVPKLVSPQQFERLLTEKKFEPLRGLVDSWAGPRLEKQWPIFLQQAKSGWEASKDPKLGLAYLNALILAGHDRTAISTFLPLFSNKIDPIEDGDLIFMISPLAGALARRGRWEEAWKLFDRGQEVWLPDYSANTINIRANRGRLLYSKGEFEKSAHEMEEALKLAEKWAGQVNVGALTGIQLYRACALQQLGRSDEGVTSSALVASRKALDPIPFVTLQLCRNDLEGARLTLERALEKDATRGAVLSFLQPDDVETYDSDFARVMLKRKLALKSDKRLLAAARKYGRVATEPLGAGAPSEMAEGQP